VEDNQLIVVPDRRNYNLDHDLGDSETVVPDRRNYSKVTLRGRPLDDEFIYYQ